VKTGERRCKSAVTGAEEETKGQGLEGWVYHGTFQVNFVRILMLSKEF
jgi:hypothetical protein